MPNPRSPNHVSGQKWRALGLLGALAALIGAGIIVPWGSGSIANSSDARGVDCAVRLIEISTSSANRSPELAEYTLRTIQRAATSAVVCGDPFSAYAVAGGGQVSTIVTSDDLASFTPIGPNAQVRSARFGAGQQAALDRLITRRLTSAYKSGDPKITSIPALYVLASEESNSATDVIFLTSGVNQDDQANLNQPLASGQGEQLAKGLPVPHVAAQAITIVGVAQVDASTPPPSPVWPQEVLSFNNSLCRSSGVRTCRIFETTSISQALN